MSRDGGLEVGADAGGDRDERRLHHGREAGGDHLAVGGDQVEPEFAGRGPPEHKLGRRVGRRWRRSELPARVIVEAPSRLGLRAAGVEALPEALLAAGLAERLGARRGTRLAPPAFDPAIDAGTGLLNPHGLRNYAPRLADAVGAVLDEGAFPIVLGGDCTILLGITLTLRRRGRSGLLFLDGHADFYQPEAEPTGEAASMELALVTGRGPELVTDLEGRRPLLRDEDVVVFGFRDADHAAAEGSQPLAPTIHAMDLALVRERGAGRAARDALAHLERTGGPAGFWIHLDVDVLDDAIMPAVDYHLPDGLTWDELTVVLRTAIASDHATGLDITIYNPTLDPDGRVTHSLVDALAAGLTP
jgi:arginase